MVRESYPSRCEDPEGGCVATGVGTGATGVGVIGRVWGSGRVPHTGGGGVRGDRERVGKRGRTTEMRWRCVVVRGIQGLCGWGRELGQE